MTSRYRHRRTNTAATAFPSPVEPGELVINTANRQLVVGDADAAALGVPLSLLAVRIFDARAQYAVGDFVVQAGVLYRANAAVNPGAFNPAQWDAISAADVNKAYVDAADASLAASTQAGFDAQTTAMAAKVAKAGDTMTGPLVLSGNPTTNLQAATKQYVDSKPGGPIISDTPPAGAPDGALWWESDTGLLYVKYNDGNTTQWVIACPQPDINSFVQKSGDTMTGNLAISKASAALTLSKTASGQEVAISGQLNGLSRWAFAFGDGAAEGGSNAGSDFRLYRFNDAGAYLGTPLLATRSTGLLTVEADPTAPLGIATKQYVDARYQRIALGGVNSAVLQVPAGKALARLTGILYPSTGNTTFPVLQLSVAAGVFRNTAGDYSLDGMTHISNTNAVSALSSTVSVAGALLASSHSNASLPMTFTTTLTLKRANTGVVFACDSQSASWQSGACLHSLLHNYLTSAAAGSALSILAFRIANGSAEVWGGESYVNVEWI